MTLWTLLGDHWNRVLLPSVACTARVVDTPAALVAPFSHLGGQGHLSMDTFWKVCLASSCQDEFHLLCFDCMVRSRVRNNLSCKFLFLSNQFWALSIKFPEHECV